MSDELNWLRPGLHYGFPWRIGGTDNPQQYPDYRPQDDLLLNPLFNAVKKGYFYNDPTFPPRPGVPLIEPIRNLGRTPTSTAIRQTGWSRTRATERCRSAPSPRIAVRSVWCSTVPACSLRRSVATASC